MVIEIAGGWRLTSSAAMKGGGSWIGGDVLLGGLTCS